MKHFHKLIRLASAAALIATLSGCAQLGMAASQINWFKVGTYAALRLSTSLNKKAEKKDREIEQQKVEQDTSAE